MTTGKEIIAQNYVAVRDLYESQDTIDILRKIMPDIVGLERLTRVSLTVIRTNEKLMSCTRESLLSCLIGCGQLGLSPDPFLGQAYFVPFWSGKKNRLEATLIPGYKGLITLARRSGQVADVDAMIVHWNDEFKAVKGLNPELHHVENEKDPGEFRGAWAMFRYQTAGWQPTWQYLSKAKIDRHMAMSKSKGKDGKVYGPWVDHYEAMALKTAIRVTSKLVPMSVEEKFNQAIKAEDMALAGLGQSDMFLPAGHAQISTRDYDVEIEQLVKGWDGREKVFEFIAVASAETGKDPVDLKKMLLSGDANLLRNFKEGFDSYLAGSKKESPAGSEIEPQNRPGAHHDEKWVSWRKEWRNKRNPEIFKKYFESNLDTLYKAPSELRMEFFKKFHNAFGIHLPDTQHEAEGLILNDYQPIKDVPAEPGASEKEGGGDGEGEPGPAQRAHDTPQDWELDQVIQFLKDNHPRVWIAEIKGKKQDDYQSKIDAILQVGGLVDIGKESPIFEQFGLVVRYSINK